MKSSRLRADLWFSLDVLSQEPLLVEGVAGLACDGINGTLVDLLPDGTQQQEEGLSDSLLQAGKKVSNTKITLA